MKRILTALFLVIGAFSLTACGETVEVPTAHVGKISTANGLKEGIITPSKLRLSNLCMTCDDLIIAETSDYQVKESMVLFMPKDQLNLTIEVRGTLATSEEQGDLEQIFARVSAQPLSARVDVIPSMKVYETYAQQIIREKVRSVVSEYTIAELMANRDSISIEIRDTVVSALDGRPVKVLNFGLADLQPPEIIVTAEEKRKQREIAIREAEADKEIRLKQAQADLEVAELQQSVELKEAETQVMVEKKLKEGFSQAYVAQRGLRILESIANSDNKVILLPSDAITDPSIMMGLTQYSLDQSETMAEAQSFAPMDAE